MLTLQDFDLTESPDVILFRFRALAIGGKIALLRHLAYRYANRELADRDAYHMAIHNLSSMYQSAFGIAFFVPPISTKSGLREMCMCVIEAVSEYEAEAA